MNNLEMLEREIRGLSRKELGEFRSWLEEYEADEWDRQIEEDAMAGKLDKLAEAAVNEQGVRRSTQI